MKPKYPPTLAEWLVERGVNVYRQDRQNHRIWWRWEPGPTWDPAYRWSWRDRPVMCDACCREQYARQMDELETARAALPGRSVMSDYEARTVVRRAGMTPWERDDGSFSPYKQDGVSAPRRAW